MFSPGPGTVGETWLLRRQAKTPRVQAFCYVMLGGGGLGGGGRVPLKCRKHLFCPSAIYSLQAALSKNLHLQEYLREVKMKILTIGFFACQYHRTRDPQPHFCPPFRVYSLNQESSHQSAIKPIYKLKRVLIYNVQS